jgi:hypothetical protein
LSTAAYNRPRVTCAAACISKNPQQGKLKTHAVCLGWPR